MYNLWSLPRATGVRQIHNLHPELPATWAERKNAGPWLAIKVPPVAIFAKAYNYPNYMNS